MWSKTCKVIDLSQKDSVEVKIEVNVKETNGDNPCLHPVYSATQKKNTLNHQDTPINKEFPKPPSHPRHNDYPTKKNSLPIPVWGTALDQAKQTSKRTDYPTAKELKIIRKIQKLEDKLNRTRYSTEERGTDKRYPNNPLPPESPKEKHTVITIHQYKQESGDQLVRVDRHFNSFEDAKESFDKIRKNVLRTPNITHVISDDGPAKGKGMVSIIFRGDFGSETYALMIEKDE